MIDEGIEKFTFRIFIDILGTFWVGRLDVQEKMMNIEKKNAGIAGFSVEYFQRRESTFFCADIDHIQTYRV